MIKIQNPMNMMKGSQYERSVVNIDGFLDMISMSL